LVQVVVGRGRVHLAVRRRLDTFSPNFLPTLGFSDGIGIDDKNARDAEEFSLDFWKRRLDPRFGPAWPTHVRMAIVGPADWTLNSVGVPVESTIEAGRKRTVWETDQPVRFFNIVGGPLVEAKGELSSVFHSPRTPWNVPTMVKALDAARRRYSEWFGPYPWRDLKLTQFPGLASYAQGFPGNISFSESIGFLSKPAGGGDDDLDSAFYIVAHEAGHQWFGNKVTPGAGPGGNIISEGLANFAALMLSFHEKGDHERQVLLRRWESNYALTRRADAERPIHRTDGSRPGDETVTYDRAGFVFWMLRDLMGEERMLAGLRAFFDKFKDGPDYPVIEDLLESLRPHAEDVAAFDVFCRQWILGKVLPEFETTTPTASFDGLNWVVRGDIKNIGTGEASVVVRVEGKEPEEKRAMIGGETVRAQFLDTPVAVAAGKATSFTILTAFRPKRILFDPEVRLLHIGRKRTEKAVDVKE
jgi:ABC-2 type transport system permease protein